MKKDKKKENWDFVLSAADAKKKRENKREKREKYEKKGEKFFLVFIYLPSFPGLLSSRFLIYFKRIEIGIFLFLL